MAAGKKLLRFGEESGIIINPETGATNKFISTAGVYFVKMLVDKQIVEGTSNSEMPDAVPSASAGAIPKVVDSVLSSPPPPPSGSNSRPRPSRGILKKGCPFGRHVVEA